MGSIIHRLCLILVCSVALAALPDVTSPVGSLLELGHFKRARALVEARLRQNPNDAQAHAWLSKIRSNFNDNEGAVTSAERAVELEPNNANYQGQLAEAYALLADRSSPLKGYAYVRRMRKATEAAYKLDPQHIDTMLVQMMFSQKAPAIAGGDKKLAYSIADKIGTISPVWGALAHARLLQGGPDDANSEMWLLKAVQTGPTLYRARASLARFYGITAVTKNNAKAERAAKDAIELDPGAEPAYTVLATVYARQQRWADLDAILARAEKAVPDDFAPYFAAAQTLFETGQNFQAAERYLTRYLSQAPEGKQPTEAEARVLLATLFEKDGRKADAVRELQAALRLQPDLQAARNSLKRLQHG